MFPKDVLSEVQGYNTIEQKRAVFCLSGQNEVVCLDSNCYKMQWGWLAEVY